MSWNTGRGGGVRRRRVMAVGAICAAMAAGSSGLAKDRDPQPGTHPVQIAEAGIAADFNIPAQDLASAIAAFGQQSGMQVTVDGVLPSLPSQPVAGRLTPEQALTQMLAGTGVTWRLGDGNTVALVPAPATIGGATTLPALTVTAERSQRSIMDTATSVQVFSDDLIEQRPDIKSTNDVLNKVANVTSVGTGNFAPAVRGVDGTGPAQGADAFLAGTRPRLNVQVDGRPLSYNEVVFGDVSLWDVEQVEVLRGAQSTLQGRNAIAGTVAVRSRAPSYDFEVGGRAVLGDYDRRYLSAMLNAPIIDDEVAVRIAVDHQRRESFVEGFNDIENAGDPDDFEAFNLRGKMLIEPEAWEGFSATFTINRSEYTAPQTESVERPFDEYEAAFPDMPVFNPSSTAGILDASWQVNDTWTLENTTSVTGIDVQRKALTGDGNVQLDALEIMTEPRVRFIGLDGDLKILSGVYYFHNDQDETIDLFGGGAFDDETTTVAVFGEGTWTFLEDFDLTLGARYENEKRRRTGQMFLFEIDLDKTYDAFLPKAGLAWRPTEGLTLGATVSRGYNGGGAGFTYDFPFESYEFKPEYVWTYEAYGRAELFDKTVNLTGNLFYSRYKNMQLPFDLNPDPDVWSMVVRNADRVKTYGAELGVRWLAAPGLEFFGDIGWLETEITRYRNSEIAGNDLAVAPNLTADIGVIYQHESGFEFSVDARYTGDYFSTVENYDNEAIDDYWVVNAQAGYVWGDDRNVRVFGFVNNLLDADDITTLEAGATPADDTAGILAPRSFGVGAEIYF